ncbi:MAG TPA: glycosyltransferase [Pyrinomonadaceae bacterium]|nr:glycosyltransferase [Pyrinomonadaceae bacterium]
MSGPLVTVIIPTYNRRRWIGECLDSVKEQTYPHVETLVIDDGSSDGTVEWLRTEPRFAFAQIHVQPRNGGASEARNAGIQLARGELIAFIDSDDALARNHLATAVEIFRQHPDAGLFCCDSTVIGPDSKVLHNGRTWHEIQGEIKRYPLSSGWRSLKDVFLFSNCFPGFTLRRNVFAQIGVFDQSLFPLDDYDLALRVAGSSYRIYYCHEPLALRRDHTGQCSGGANAVHVCRQTLQTLRLALARNPELCKLGPLGRRRLAEVQVELGVSRIYAGERTGGARTLLRAVTTDPKQIVNVALLGKRRLRRLII